MSANLGVARSTFSTTKGSAEQWVRATALADRTT